MRNLRLRIVGIVMGVPPGQGISSTNYAHAVTGLRLRVIRVSGPERCPGYGASSLFALPPDRLFPSLRVICGEYRQF